MKTIFPRVVRNGLVALPLVYLLCGCLHTSPQTAGGQKSPFSLTFTAIYQQTDKIRAEKGSAPIKERRYTMRLSSDGVRSFQQLDPANEPPAARTTYIFDGKNQIFLKGTYPDANAPRSAAVQPRYVSLTNPLRPMLEFGGTPVADLLGTIKVKRVGTERSADFGPLEVYDADFGNDIAMHYTGRFRVTTRTPRMIVDSIENSDFGGRLFRNEFHCKGLRVAGGVSLPEICEVTSYQSPETKTPMGTAHFVLTDLSDKPLPDADFSVTLPPGSHLFDNKNRNVWRVGAEGKLIFDRHSDPGDDKMAL